MEALPEDDMSKCIPLELLHEVIGYGARHAMCRLSNISADAVAQISLPSHVTDASMHLVAGCDNASNCSSSQSARPQRSAEKLERRPMREADMLHHVTHALLQRPHAYV